jgi:hypothetical protein
MPLITVPIQPLGPLVIAAVAVSQPRVAALTLAGQPLPAPVSGTFLIDTGATSSCVDLALMQPLGLPPIGKVHMVTPSTGGTPVVCDQFDASFIIPGNSPEGTFVIPALPLLGVSLAGQSIHGLIGRDILDRCMITYHGPAKIVTFAH